LNVIDLEIKINKNWQLIR